MKWQILITLLVILLGVTTPALECAQAQQPKVDFGELEKLAQEELADAKFLVPHWQS